MLKTILKPIFIIGLTIILSSFLRADELELIWEKNYPSYVKQSSGALGAKSYFSFDLASDTDRILLVNTFWGGGWIPDSTTITLFELDIHSGKSNVIVSSDAIKGQVNPMIVNKYDDTISMLLPYYAPWGQVILYKIYKSRAKFSKFGGGFIFDPSYLNLVIDTSLKSPDYTFMEGLNLYHNRNCGVINRLITDTGTYRFQRMTTEDTLTIVKLHEGDFLEGFDIASIPNLWLHERFIQEIDTNKHLMVAELVTMDDKRLHILTYEGLLIVCFDDEGKIITKKVFREQQEDRNKTRYLCRYYANGYIYMVYQRWTNGAYHSFIREHTVDGEITKDIPFNNYNNTPILKEYTKQENDLALSIITTDKNEIYFYGAIRKGPSIKKLEPYSCYVSKFDSSLNLIYEKCWKVGDTTALNGPIIRNILFKDGYLYVKAVDGYSNLFVSKFKEPTTSISEPLSLVSSIVYPNPTAAENIATVRLELEDASDLRIVLSDVLGQEIMQVYEGFVDAGTFTKSFTTQHLSKGVYFLKTLIGGQYKVEKIVVND